MMGNGDSRITKRRRVCCFPLWEEDIAGLPDANEVDFDALTARLHSELTATTSAAAVRAFVAVNKLRILQWRALFLLGAKMRTDASIAPAVRLLLGHREALALFVGSGDVDKGKFGEALQILHRISTGDDGGAPHAPEGVKLRIAVAVALTFSTPVLAFADGAPIDPVQRYASFCAWYDDGVLVPNFRHLTAWHLRYVVGSWARDEELVWARQHLPPDATVATLGNAAMKMVPYKLHNDEGVSVHTGNAYYGGQPKTLAVLHRIGGVCGAISKFSVAMCQAFGIPSMPVAQPGHCAHLWRDPDADAWKVDNDNSGLSHSSCHDGIQMTWGKTAWLIPMMELAQQDFEAYIDSECLRAIATLLSDKALHGDICAEARTVCPANFLAWIDCVSELRHLHSHDTRAWVDSAWTQLCAEAADPRDLALMRPGVKVSDCAERAINLVDGTGSEWWTGDSTAWIEIDLEEACSIQSVRIQWWGISVAAVYTIYSAPPDSTGITFVHQRSHHDAVENPVDYNGWTEVPGWEAPTRRVRVEMSQGMLDPWGKRKLFGIRQIIVRGTFNHVCHEPSSVLKLVAARDLSVCALASRHICAEIDNITHS
eukprot:GEMP01021513.1.p1 GENE.GEMP01021513.1~~GEMP01021513.1.p1  ORF type:complete len:598 (+),score=148.68 GEMP01021513.1:39-1832(+)